MLKFLAFGDVSGFIDRYIRNIYLESGTNVCSSSWVYQSNCVTNLFCGAAFVVLLMFWLVALVFAGFSCSIRFVYVGA